MPVLVRWCFTGLAVLALVYVGERGLRATHAAVPGDMPADAEFIQSGYDLAHNQALGAWIACRALAEERTDWCRVTTATGEVLYEGDYLPLDGAGAAVGDELRVSEVTSRSIWVRGPAEGRMVPLIRLKNGRVLLPAADRDVLRDRWQADPEELEAFERGEGD